MLLGTTAGSLAPVNGLSLILSCVRIQGSAGGSKEHLVAVLKLLHEKKVDWELLHYSLPSLSHQQV